MVSGVSVLASSLSELAMYVSVNVGLMMMFTMLALVVGVLAAIGGRRHSVGDESEEDDKLVIGKSNLTT